MADSSEPALLPAIIFCDQVIKEDGTGKLSLIGCFQGFVFKAFPARKGRFFVVVAVTNLRGQLKELNVTVRIEDPKSGHVLSSSGGHLQFTGREGEVPTLQPSMVLELPIPMTNVTFPQAGTYSAVVLVDNELLDRRNFGVVAITSAGPVTPD
jgi:hypothetical protein